MSAELYQLKHSVEELQFWEKQKCNGCTAQHEAIGDCVCKTIYWNKINDMKT